MPQRYDKKANYLLSESLHIKRKSLSCLASSQHVYGQNRGIVMACQQSVGWGFFQVSSCLAVVSKLSKRIASLGLYGYITAR